MYTINLYFSDIKQNYVNSIGVTKKHLGAVHTLHASSNTNTYSRSNSMMYSQMHMYTCMYPERVTTAIYILYLSAE